MKTDVELKRCLPLFLYAKRHVNKHQSSAEDAETPQRQVTFFLQRIINSISGSVEVSDTQMALALLGMSPTQCSTTFSWVCPMSGVRYLESCCDNESASEKEDNDSVCSNNELDIEINETEGTCNLTAEECNPSTAKESLPLGAMIEDSTNNKGK